MSKDNTTVYFYKNFTMIFQHITGTKQIIQFSNNIHVNTVKANDTDT